MDLKIFEKMDAPELKNYIQFLLCFRKHRRILLERKIHSSALHISHRIQ